MMTHDSGDLPGSEDDRDDEGTFEKVDGGRRPTPVRAAMDGGENEQSGGRAETRVIREEEKGRDWVVTVSGRTASGVLPLRTVALLELSFSREDEPLKALRQAILPGVDLAQLSDEDLINGLRRSRPYREPNRELLGGGSKGRGGKGRKPQKG
jgi:hypothetical protein